MPDAKIAIWVQPRASRTEVAGRHGDAIKIKLAAPPVDGAANEALLLFLSEILRLPKSAVTLLSGHTGRRKTIAVAGMTSGEVASKLLE